MTLPQRWLVSDRTPCLGQAGRACCPHRPPGRPGEARGPRAGLRSSSSPSVTGRPAQGRTCSAPRLGATPGWCCSWGDFAQMSARVYTRVFLAGQGHDTRVCLCLCTRTHKPGSPSCTGACGEEARGPSGGPGSVVPSPGTASYSGLSGSQRLLRPSSVPPISVCSPKASAKAGETGFLLPGLCGSLGGLSPPAGQEDSEPLRSWQPQAASWPLFCPLPAASTCQRVRGGEGPRG